MGTGSPILPAPTVPPKLSPGALTHTVSGQEQGKRNPKRCSSSLFSTEYIWKLPSSFSESSVQQEKKANLVTWPLPTPTHSSVHLSDCSSNIHWQTSLVVQWLRISLLMQGTRVQSLAQEDSTCLGATKPMCRNYSACMLQLRKPIALELVLCNKKSYYKEKPRYHNQKVATTWHSWRKPGHSNKNPMQPKIK